MDGDVQGCIIVNGVPNILSTTLTYMRGGKYYEHHQYTATT